MALNDKPTIYYRVVTIPNPGNPDVVLKHPVITRRETYSIARTLRAAIDSGRIRGKYYDLLGIISGFMDQVRTQLEAGHAVNMEFMRLHAELTGLSAESELITSANGLNTCVTPLTELKLDIDKFNWQRVDDSGVKLSLLTIKGEGCKIGTVKSNTLARINGRNCLMSDGDTLTLTLGDQTISCEILNSDDDTIEFRVPEIDAAFLKKEYVFTVTSRCGVEGGSAQTKTIRATILEETLSPGPHLKSSLSDHTGNADEVHPFADTVTATGRQFTSDTEVFLKLFKKATGDELASLGMSGGNHYEIVDDKTIKLVLADNVSSEPDDAWFNAANEIRLIAKAGANESELVLTPVR